ncbi:MAG TPA: hypothetical protein VK481_01005 [Gemmatimonadaceae bacterium]|nr:hypothetical protein [Gemmatimonadaceae bacterium]
MNKSVVVEVLQAGGIVLLSLAALTVSLGLGLAALVAGAVIYGVALERD